MEWLNYHHLLYFWTVARTGSVSRAAVELRLAQPTLSGQIRALEAALGTKLFQRVGRGLVLTEVGEMTFRYADKIFGLGRELQDAIRTRAPGPQRLVVGISDVLNKSLAFRLLQPALALAEPVRLVCVEDKPERLHAELASNRVDIVLADAPLADGKTRPFNAVLGECGVAVLGTKDLVKAHKRGFPETLQDAPFLFPTEQTALRGSLERYFEGAGVAPRVMGEFGNCAMLAHFAAAGTGLVAVPSTVSDTMCEQYALKVCGELSGVKERVYVASAERHPKHPVVQAIAEFAQQQVFA